MTDYTKALSNLLVALHAFQRAGGKVEVDNVLLLTSVGKLAKVHIPLEDAYAISNVMTPAERDAAIDVLHLEVRRKG